MLRGWVFLFRHICQPGDPGVGQYVVVHPTDPVLIGINHKVLKGAPVQIDRIVKAHGTDLIFASTKQSI